MRRLKEDLKDAKGRRLFPDRHTHTVTFCLNHDEYALYKSVTAYINEFIPQQTGQRRSSAALTRTVLQRRLVSSACAIHESIQRRTKKQERLLKELEQQAQKVRQYANDSKLAALKRCLGEAQFLELKDGWGKLLVFTEHRDTLNYVRNHLKRWGYTTCEIHGGLTTSSVY